MGTVNVEINFLSQKTWKLICLITIPILLFGVHERSTLIIILHHFFLQEPIYGAN
jgi:hypothetical protein